MAVAFSKFLSGGGETGELIRNYDWAATSFGKPDNWPQNLLVTLSNLLRSPFPMFLCWGNDRICFYNDACLRNFGTEAKDAAVCKSGEEIWGETWKVIKPSIEKVWKKGESTWSEDQPIPVYRNSTTEVTRWTFGCSPVLNEEGNIDGVLVVCSHTTGNLASLQNVTALHNQADTISQASVSRQLKESETRFRRLVEEAPIPMCLYTGNELKIQIINDALLEVWGKDKSVIGKTLQEALPEIEEQVYLALLRKVYDTKTTLSVKNAESKIYKNGKLETMYYDLWYKPIVDEDSGNVYGILASGVDVSEKVLLLRKTMESEMHLKMIVEHASVAIAFTKGPEMILENINEPMARLLNISTAVIGQPLLKVVPALNGQATADILKKVFAEGETYKGYQVPVTVIINGSPANMFYDISYIPLVENGITNYILHLAIDVTQQVAARVKIEEAEARTKVAIESANLGTYEINLLNDEMITSERFNTIWGVDHRTMSRSEFAASIHTDDRELRRQAHKQSLQTGQLYYEARIVWKDQSIHWIRVNGTVLFDKGGKATQLLGVIKDITEQKIIQQRKDNFIAMASHELKTPLTSIKAFAQIIGMKLAKKGDVDESKMIDKIDSQINKLLNLVGDLLNISKIDTGRLVYERGYFNLNDCVSQLVEELQHTTTHHLQLRLSETVIVCADRNRIEQVITNLVSNAIKYSPGSAAVNIKTGVVNNEVIFSIEDFGIGINKGEHDLVFSQFYRVNNTKHQSFPGMGLGLYICYTIITHEGGRIWVESKEDKGSTFYFALPLQNDKMAD